MAREKQREPEDWKKDANRDAARMALHYLDEIVAHILKDGKAPDDLYGSYKDGDEYHHYHHIARSYTLREAADLLEQLEAYEADREQISESMSARQIVSLLAAHTYGNAVYEFWVNLIAVINGMVEDEGFVVGPKEWSPYNKEAKLEEFVRDIIN